MMRSSEEEAGCKDTSENVLDDEDTDEKPENTDEKPEKAEDTD
jgi:hypothetical protein